MISKISTIFKPTTLDRVAKYCVYRFLFLSIFLFAVGSYVAFFKSPIDYQQGEYVRFMYIHVPASWFALGIYTMMAGLSISGYAFKIPTAHLLTRAFAIPGCLMAFISLVTGSLWGKVTWGTYWVWDARLTSMFILFLIYGGYIVMSHKKKLEQLHNLSIFVMIGVVNIPIIKYSVDLWFTLHQPASIMRLSKPAIHQAFLIPLFVFAGAYFFFIFAVASRIFLKEMSFEKQRQQKLMTFRQQASKSFERAA